MARSGLAGPWATFDFTSLTVGSLQGQFPIPSPMGLPCPRILGAARLLKGHRPEAPEEALGVVFFAPLGFQGICAGP